MGRLLFEAQGVRIRAGRLATGTDFVVYTDAAGTVLADISATVGGSAIAGSTVTVTDIAGFGPSALQFYGPTDDTAVLYLRCPSDASLGVQEIEADIAGGGGGGIAATIFDAKGDLIAASAADTAARVAAGANGTLLVADSTATAGLKWVAPNVYNVKAPPFNAVGDGTTDDAAAIQAAIAAAKAAAGGVVFFPGGVYIVGTTLSLPSAVHLVGSGIGGEVFGHDAGFPKGGTVLKLKNSVDVDLVRTESFATLTGDPSPSVYLIPQRFGLRDLVLDGNKLNNTSGRCLAIYGRNHIIHNVIIQNAAEDGVYSESRGGAGYDEEALWSNFRVTDSGGDGMVLHGPHDSQFVNGFVARNGAIGIQVNETMGSTRFTNVHNWGNGTIEWDIQCGDISCINCTSDGVGTICGIRVSASRFQWRGGSIYGENQQGEVLVQVGNGDGGSYNVRGCTIDTIWYNLAVGAVPLRYMTDGGLQAAHNFFGRYTFANTNARVVVGLGRTTSTGSQAGDAATFNVADTTGFLAAGNLYVAKTGTGGTGMSLITYTGTTATSFTGCTGGNALQTVPDGTTVFQEGSGLTNSNRETWWFEAGDEGLSASIQIGYPGPNQQLFQGMDNNWSGVQKFNGNVGFYGTTPIAKPTVTGSRGGNAALADLLTKLAALGLITDSSS